MLHACEYKKNCPRNRKICQTVKRKMGDRGENFTVYKINTLEDCLKKFNKPCLLKQLDMNLELVRRNKETKEKHFNLLKSVDKDLLKLSQIHHPDKAIGQKKSAEEVTEAQNLQTALNCTRTVLKALTEVFLKDIDVYYKYEFFARLDINTLINEKQIELEINNVLCKIGRLSEIKRVDIIGQVRKFLLKCQNSLENFRHDNKQAFLRHRDSAFRHLQKCIEGYEMLLMECNLIVDDCSAEEDKNTKRVIQNMYKQYREESKILQDLQAVAKKSLGRTFKIFPFYEPRYDDHMNPIVYEPVVTKELEYIVSPFMYYVDILLMCSVMVGERSLRKKVETKFWEIWEYNKRHDLEESIFFKEPALLKAYYLASYFDNKNRYEEKVQAILRGRDLFTSESNFIKQTFKETVKEIEQYLASEFNIDSCKEGKSNLRQFNERLFAFKDSMTEFEALRKNLQEKFKVYEQETCEIRKDYSEFSRNIDVTGEQNKEAKNPFPEPNSGYETGNKVLEMEFD